MSIVLYAAGLLIGIALFLYILSLYNTGKSRVTGFAREKKPSENGREGKKTGITPGDKTAVTEIKSENIRFKGLSDVPPGERICPLCRTPLTRFEPLYASQTKTESGQKILIHGCPRCYKGNA